MLDLLDELREFPDSETAGRTRALIVRATPRFAFVLDPRNRSYYLDPREITGGVVAAAGTIVSLPRRRCRMAACAGPTCEIVRR
jgi:hypothetical protein